MGMSLHVHKKHVIELERIHDVFKNNQEAFYEIIRKAGVSNWYPDDYYQFIEVDREELRQALPEIAGWEQSAFNSCFNGEVNKEWVLDALQQMIDESDPNEEMIYCEWF